MPQIFQVLKCYKCLVFQVHPPKICNQFACKMCGEKQSIKRQYGVATSQDCRKHVQKLNSLRGEMQQTLSSQENTDDSDENSSTLANVRVKKSKWVDFTEEESTDSSETEENMMLGDAKVYLEIPKKRHKHNYIRSYKPNIKESTSEINFEYPKESEKHLNTRNIKPNKFACKMCGEKQSTKREYGVATGQECQKHVQNLICLRGENRQTLSSQENTDDSDENSSTLAKVKVKKSKWVSFTKEKPTDTCDTEENMMLGDAKVYLEIPKKRHKHNYIRSYEPNIKESTSEISLEYQKVSEKHLNTHNIELDIFDEKQIKQQEISSSEIYAQDDNAVENVTCKQTKITKFIPPAFKVNSKWSKIADTEKSDSESENNNKLVSNLDKCKQTKITKFIPPAIKVNSKWSKFADSDKSDSESENNNKLVSTLDKTEIANDETLRIGLENKVQSIFTLCSDDDELDAVLNI